MRKLLGIRKMLWDGRTDLPTDTTRSATKNKRQGLQILNLYGEILLESNYDDMPSKAAIKNALPVLCRNTLR